MRTPRSGVGRALMASTLLLAITAAPAAAAIGYSITSSPDGDGQVRATGSVSFPTKTRANVSGELIDFCPKDGWGGKVSAVPLYGDGRFANYGDTAYNGEGCGSGVPYNLKVQTSQGAITAVRITVCEYRVRGRTSTTDDCSTRTIERR